MWRLVGPPLETQKQFNAALVDHLNRNAASHRESARSMAALIDVVGRELQALVRFESLLIQSLQKITGYVDTKDRSLGGPEIRQRLALTEQRLLALKRDVASRGSVASTESAATPSAPVFSGAVDSVTYVAFEDEFRGSQETIRRRVEIRLPIVIRAPGLIRDDCWVGSFSDGVI